MKKVVIIGGGYAGLYALRQLVKEKNIKITVIDKKTFHNLQPEVYDLIANKSTFADISIDLTTLTKGVEHPHLEYKNLKVRTIDKEKQIIHTEEKETVPYDVLILAYGTRTFFPSSIEGLNNAHDIKKLHWAMYFKQSFEKELFKKIQDESKKCYDTNIVVVGAGLSGVEIAAEMAYNSKKFFQRGNFGCDDLSITLVSSGDTILPGLNQELINISQRRLKELGIKLITNAKLTKMDQEYAYLSNGTKIRQSFLIFAGGIEANKIAGLEELTTNPKGQYIVTDTLQTDKENIFAIGDIAEIRGKNAELLPPCVTVARYTGIQAAKNVISYIKGKDLKPHNSQIEGIMVALGGKYAAGNIYGLINVKGRIAYMIKSFIFWSYKLPLLKLIKKGYKLFKKDKKRDDI